jgi:hypothetical protein
MYPALHLAREVRREIFQSCKQYFDDLLELQNSLSESRLALKSELNLRLRPLGVNIFAFQRRSRTDRGVKPNPHL